MNYEDLYMLEEMMAGMTIVSNLSSLLSLAAYIFSSLAVYTIAQRRGINHAWMAWVPLVNVWILGSISDNYRLVAKGEKKNKRKVLLAVNILIFVLALVASVTLTVNLVLAISGMSQGGAEMELVRSLLSGMAFFIPVIILSIVSLVVDAMALYDLYTSCDPANNVLYLVLSLIPGINSIARPLFLFLCRDKDAGMPPRKQALPENPSEF